MSFSASKRFHECVSPVSFSIPRSPYTPSSPPLSPLTIRFAPCQLRPAFAPPLPPLHIHLQPLAAKAHFSTVSAVSMGTLLDPLSFPPPLPRHTTLPRPWAPRPLPYPALLLSTQHRWRAGAPTRVLRCSKRRCLRRRQLRPRRP